MTNQEYELSLPYPRVAKSRLRSTWRFWVWNRESWSLERKGASVGNIAKALHPKWPSAPEPISVAWKSVVIAELQLPHAVWQLCLNLALNYTVLVSSAVLWNNSLQLESKCSKQREKRAELSSFKRWFVRRTKQTIFP